VASSAAASTEALNLLRYFWSQNGKKADPKTYAPFDVWLEESTRDIPRFLSLFSSQVKTAREAGFTQARLLKAMDVVVSKYAGKLPDRRGMQNFLNAVTEQAFTTSFKTDLAVQGVKEGVQEVGKAIEIGSKMVLTAALVFGGFVAMTWLAKFKAPTPSPARANPRRRSRA